MTSQRPRSISYALRQLASTCPPTLEGAQPWPQSSPPPVLPRRTRLQPRRCSSKAQGLPADQVFLDLEDAVAPLAKPDARKNIVAALNEGDWAGKTRVVRVNDLTTQWTYRDVIEVVEGAGAEPRLRHAAEGAERRARSLARPDADPDREDRSASRSAGSASRRRSRTPAAWSTWTPSPPPRPGSRRSSSVRPTSWPRST